MNTLNFRNDKKWLIVAITALLIVAPENFGKSSKETVPNSPKHSFHTQGNPYLPLWEHVPDGEPRVFEDPDNPGKYRVYIIGSHDVRSDSYCGLDIRAWSAPVEDLSDWRDEGPIFTYAIDGQWDIMFAPDLVEIKKKDKRNFGKVESAFLKDNTDVYDVTFQTEKSIKIKIEVDTCPPLNFKTEQKLLLQPYSFMTRCFTLPDLFAGKMHALVYRAWKNRVKGRDWYDFEWYVRHNVPLDFTHLAERCKQFNNEDITPELFKEKLIERLSTADIKQVKADVLPFVRNPKELDIWSNDYFIQLAGMVRIE